MAIAASAPAEACDRRVDKILSSRETAAESHQHHHDWHRLISSDRMDSSESQTASLYNFTNVDATDQRLARRQDHLSIGRVR